MNVITFLESAKPKNEYTEVTREMRNFIGDKHAKRNLSKLLGSELAKTIYSIAQPEIDRVSAIISRVQVAIDYSLSGKALDDYKAVVDEFKNDAFFSTGEIINFTTRGQQSFAYDDYHAYDVTETILHCADDDVVIFKVPYILYTNGVDKSLSFTYPDEGSSGGLASIVFVDNPKRKTYAPKVGFSKFMYIYTSELNLSSEQIFNNIINEIEKGETPLSGGGLPGWG